MKKANFIFLSIMALALSFASCGDDSSPDEESSYVSFTGEGYNSGKWNGGFNDSMSSVSREPFAAYKTSWTSCFGARETIISISFFDYINNSCPDFVYVGFNGNTVRSYNGTTECKVFIKYATAHYKTFNVSSPVVTVTKYNSDVIAGEFSGKDFNNKDITGQFLFTNLGDGNWTGNSPWAGMP